MGIDPDLARRIIEEYEELLGFSEDKDFFTAGMFAEKGKITLSRAYRILHRMRDEGVVENARGYIVTEGEGGKKMVPVQGWRYVKDNVVE